MRKIVYDVEMGQDPIITGTKRKGPKMPIMNYVCIDSCLYFHKGRI